MCHFVHGVSKKACVKCSQISRQYLARSRTIQTDDFSYRVLARERKNRIICTLAKKTWPGQVQPCTSHEKQKPRRWSGNLLVQGRYFFWRGMHYCKQLFSFLRTVCCVSVGCSDLLDDIVEEK